MREFSLAPAVRPVLRPAVRPPLGKGGGWWKAGAALDIDFANQRAYNLSSGFNGLPQALLTVSRASGGGYYNAAGVYVFDATNNSLRYDYDPVTHAALGVLIEEQRTNLLTYSEQFDTVWSKSNFTVTADAVAAPDGTTTADKLQATTTAACLFYRTVAVAGTSATFSVFIKRGSGDTDINTFGVRNATTATNLLFVTVNYATGAITYSTGSSGAVMTDEGNGWWRLALSVSGITSGDGITVYCGGSGATETAGEYAYMWGAQLEAGAFATSYIPTTSAQVTRAADNISLATTAFSFNAAEGTVSAAADAPNISTSNLGVFALGTSASVIMRYFRQTDAQPVFQVVDTTTQATLGLGATWSSSASVKSAMAYQVNNFAASKNGGTPVTDTSGTVPAVAASLVFGNAAGIGYLNGHISRLTYWKTRKSDPELQVLAA